ncbi:hypothetical protein FNH22_24390 [Fulvivirga sp. M361]|uniref:hypothetical protein n=1 Tax=Fulvivirga sp. M361 TaxID=2594266 RepID=UPI00117B895E|nr:hypothetical protein [Fulvivirga sp. M361]TRX51278.1 hypothetical protein FNH22_24390 [Fulvivirga sp. M361]
MSDIRKPVKQFVEQELTKASLEVFSSERESRGVDFIAKTPSRKYHELFLQPINLDFTRSVKIPKGDLGEPKDNLWIALVFVMKEIEPVLHLIPSKVLENPDNYIFFNHEQDERFSHLSNWEIKVFQKSIGELSKYSLTNMASRLD